MKKVGKKNQIVITALAVMIAVAGYISYTQTVGNDKEVMKQEAYDQLTYDISEEDMVGDIFTDTEDNTVAAGESDLTAQTEAGDLSTQGDAALTAQNTADETAETGLDQPGEAVLTSSENTVVDFAAQARLSREQVRAKNKETLLEIMNNTGISEEQKQDAVDTMIEITDLAERENAAELLLEAKGFEGAVVSITDDTADVVVEMTEVDDAGRAQIEDIVKRKTGIEAENIIITPIAK